VSEPIYAGVELGGTKCVAILARGPGEILGRQVIATTTPEQTLDAIERQLLEWNAEHGFAALGIASFGPIELDERSPAYGQIVRTSKPGWSDTDVARRLELATGVPTVFDTDVNGAAFAEVRWGAGRGFDDFAYITVGTGVGVGLIVNGKPTRGFAHSEMGHIRPVRLTGDDFAGCCPYHGDCVEGLASGPAIQGRLGGRSIAALAMDDALWDAVAWTLAQLCHAIVCAAAPRAIAIGGGVTAGQAHLLERIEHMLVESLGGYMPLPPGRYVQAPGLGADAGPLGAIALAMNATL
jgi:fructokinase